jgi:hypothetical protein
MFRREARPGDGADKSSISNYPLAPVLEHFWFHGRKNVAPRLNSQFDKSFPAA